MNTDVDGQALADATGKLVLTRDLRRLFDYYLLALGQKTMGEIDQDVTRQLQQSLPPSAAAQAHNLWHRYLTYRDRLVQESADHLSTDAYANCILSLTGAIELQQEIFSPDEIEQLFADDLRELQQSLLLVAAAAKSATAAEMKSSWRTIFAELPPAQVKARRRSLLASLYVDSLRTGTAPQVPSEELDYQTLKRLKRLHIE